MAEKTTTDRTGDVSRTATKPASSSISSKIKKYGPYDRLQG